VLKGEGGITRGARIGGGGAGAAAAGAGCFFFFRQPKADHTTMEAQRKTDTTALVIGSSKPAEIIYCFNFRKGFDKEQSDGRLQKWSKEVIFYKLNLPSAFFSPLVTSR
jgi:hypothetical protein